MALLQKFMCGERMIRPGSQIPAQPMHILIIPSEEFIPEHAPLAGVFQAHQIAALSTATDFKMGALSIRLALSVWMLLRAIACGLVGIKGPQEMEGKTSLELLRLLKNKLFRPQDFVTFRAVQGTNVVAAEGFYYFPPSPLSDYIGWVRAGFAAFESYVARFGLPDLIHAHNALYAGLLAKKINLRYSIPYVLTEHSSYYHQNLVPPSLYKNIRASIYGAYKTMVVSQALKSSMIDKLGLGQDFLVMPNVLPAAFEEGIPIRPSEDSGDGFRFLCVGNLLPVKGQDLLVEAFIELSNMNSTASLVFVGDGPDRQKLEDRVRDSKLETRVSFAGYCSSDEVMKWIHGSDALVLPSRFETFGVVLIEALSCGIPVVATSCGGPNDIITEADGLLVAPESVAALKEGMLAMIGGRTFDSGDLRRRAMSRFGAAAFSAEISKVYKSAFSDA